MIWQQWWGDAGAVVAILSAIWALGRKIGKQEQAMKHIKDKVALHDTTLIAHTAELSNGKGDFKVITEKFIGVGNKLDGLADGQKEIRDLLVQHITKRT
jgi:hypothetical protein